MAMPASCWDAGWLASPNLLDLISCLILQPTTDVGRDTVETALFVC